MNLDNLFVSIWLESAYQTVLRDTGRQLDSEDAFEDRKSFTEAIFSDFDVLPKIVYSLGAMAEEQFNKSLH